MLLQLNRTIVETVEVLVPKSKLTVGEDGDLDFNEDEDALFETADNVYNSDQWSVFCPEREVEVIGEAGDEVEARVKTIWDGEG